MKTMYEIPDLPNLAKVVVEENVIWMNLNLFSYMKTKVEWEKKG